MEDKSISLIAVGDIMLGDLPLFIGHGVGSKLKEVGSGFLFSNVHTVLNEGDITFANLECPLSEIDINKKSLYSVSLRGSEKSVNDLKDAGFNLVSLANNHILQHGKSTLNRTKELLQQNGIVDIGVANTKDESRQVFIEEIKGTKIGFLAYCLIGDKTAYCSVNDTSEIIKDVSFASSKVDVLIVSLHWGDEFIRKPSPQQVELGHAIIDAGAKIILGHHPHVLQGLEEYESGIITYSLGNFVCDMKQKKTRESMIFSCKLSKNGIEDYDIVPIMIGKNYTPQIMKYSEKKKLMNKLKKDYLQLEKEEQYIKEVKRCRTYNRISLAIYLLLNFYKYNSCYSKQIINNLYQKTRGIK
jgi:poly-gamma-glutamate synthesis protein (capsule biosynthesis protein)